MAFMECGCPAGALYDAGDTDTKDEVATFEEQGYRVERMPLEQLNQIIERDKLGCHCKERAIVHAEAAEAENKRLLAMLKHIYEPARIAASQIVCLGGEETCQPCENRESLLTALAEVETELKGGEE